MASLLESNSGKKFNVSEEPCPRFSLADIEKATNNFTSMVIGQGGFAKVYKGEIQIINGGANSTTVAIKRMSSMSPESRKEFQQEISMVYKFRHSNLVSLLGYCETDTEMIFVYEYVGGGTLKDALRRSGNNNVPLSWIERLKICVSAARGLHYLHTGTSNKHKVIHRDVKSSNILLDENREIAKISDFGLSKIGPTNQSNSGVSTRVAGTRGYLDPDYCNTGILTSKSDVFSFAVVLFELLCGRPALDFTLHEDQWNLAGWAHQCVEKKKVKQLVDPNLNSQILPSSLSAFVKVADRCLHARPTERPTTTEVLAELERALKLQGSGKVATGFHVGRRKYAKKWWLLFSVTHRPISDNNADYSATEVVPTDHTHNIKINTIDVPSIEVDELEKITDNFGIRALICEGSCGRLYIGILKSGQAACIKSFDSSLLPISEFVGQVCMVSRLNHENFLKLLSYCVNGGRRFLVYEYASQGSLHDILHGWKAVRGAQRCQVLSWTQRVRIAIGAAKGLEYLHEEANITHRNINSRNVLLFRGNVVKIADLSLSNQAPDMSECLISAGVIEKIGYLPPEYAITGQMNSKSDVYSFGVVLLELLTGRKPFDHTLPCGQQSLVTWATPKLRSDKVKQCIDPGLSGEFHPRQAAKMASVAGLCLQTEADLRPKMSIVAKSLQSAECFTSTLNYSC
ncbi:hypothetical protein LguiA_001613 [Lonicera macranthoides]